MSKNNLVIGVAVAIIILWLLGQISIRDKKILNLEKEIENHRNLNSEIKKKLKGLIENNKDIDPDIANELAKISALLEIKQDSKAILSLVKIIENLLNKLYDSDTRLNLIASKNMRTRPSFMD